MTRSLGELALAVKRLQVRHHRNIDAALAPLGITLAQWDALRHLHENPDASLHDLARLTFQTDQSMGILARRLLDRGLVERVPAPGRAVRHRLTARGQELRTSAQHIVDDVLAASFATLDREQLAQLDTVLARLVPPPDAH